MRTLLLDIETTPNLADVWGLYDQNVGLSQLRQPTRLLCFSAMWLDAKPKQPVFYGAVDLTHSEMVGYAHGLLDQADVVMTWNGKRFDIPHLNREFLEGGLKPPSPYRQIDLMETAKRQFKFPSNKLDYVARALGAGGKVQHEGHELWVKCMEGDPKAWAKMERYNKRDVLLLERLYRKLQPWVQQHPSHAAMLGAFICPACGSGNLQARGKARTLQSAYQRYQCQNCGKWSRSTKRDFGTTIREVASG